MIAAELRGPAPRWSCWRWAATATSPISSSLSSRACSSSIWAAACRSEDGSISIFAGSTLGGRHGRQLHELHPHPRAHPREWAAAGIEGIDRPGYDAHIDAIWERLKVNDAATSQNRTHKTLIGACEKLGYSHRQLTAMPRSMRTREFCGYCFAGLSEGVQAVRDEDVPAGCLGQRRPFVWLPRRGDPRGGAGAPSGSGNGHQCRRLDHHAGRSIAHRRGRVTARSSRRRCCCARASAGRRPASICGCTRLASSRRLRASDRRLDRADPVGAVG